MKTVAKVGSLVSAVTAGVAQIGIKFSSGVAPPLGNKKKVEFLILGDWGCGRTGCAQYGGAAGQYAVADAMAVSATDDPVDFVMNVGDGMYYYGVERLDDSKFNDTFTSVYDYPSLQVPWYGVLGNHEWKMNASVLVTNYLNWRIPALGYTMSGSVGGIPITFFFVDTNRAEFEEICSARSESKWGPLTEEETDACQQEILTVFPQVIDWLRTQLLIANGHIKIVVGHEPVYASGRWAFNRPSSEGVLAEAFQSLFDTYSVDAYIGGHDHVMEHLFFSKTNFFIVGNSGVGGADWEDQPIFRATPAESKQVVSKAFGFARASVNATEFCIDFYTVDPGCDLVSGDYPTRYYGARPTYDTPTGPATTHTYNACFAHSQGV